VEKQRYYICIDLKSFFASVECVERGLDPLKTNLVVADSTRTEKTICLAVTPSLKSYGLGGRARLFEVVSKVREANNLRRKNAPRHVFTAESYNDDELKKRRDLSISYIVAPPRMAYYMAYSTRIYEVYLKYIAPEDIHVYSIDEVFIDATSYLSAYKTDAINLARKIIKDVFEQTGITATAGIGTNMFLAKVAMDIVAKKTEPDQNGARLAYLDEMSFRKNLWSHKPITDFWRIGAGTAKRLASVGLFTMGDIAKCSLGDDDCYYNEDLLYKLFGINAELLIDHAWGWEPCTIEDIRSYKPSAKSISSGQVLHCPYDYEKTKLIVREMTEALTLDLVRKGYVTNSIVLTVGYDIENLSNSEIKSGYKGEITSDFYGRKVPKQAHGTGNLGGYTSSGEKIMNSVMELYDRIINKNLLSRRITISANNLIKEEDAPKKNFVQLNFFTDIKKNKKDEEKEDKEKKIQKVMLDIKEKYGKNAVLKGTNLKEGATAIERNSQIGGHRA